MNQILLVIFAILIQNYNVFSVKYENYTLYKTIPVNNRHLKFLRNLDNVFPSVNFWKHPGLLNSPVEFTISPEHNELFIRNANVHGIYLQTLMKNVQTAFDKQTVETYSRRNLKTFEWKNYYKYEDIYNWLTDLRNLHPHETEIIKFGTTHEGRELIAFKIKLSVHTRSTVIIEGGIHAREWIAPAVVTYLIHSILNANENGTNSDFKTIAKEYEWYFIPLLNPDGYAFTYKEDRMWRKNRKPYLGGIGVDLNRNFPISFGGVGVSKNTNSDIYCGPSAFSEHESRALAEFINSKSESLEYYLSFHAYGQYIIIPYAHTEKYMDNFQEVKNICKKAATLIKKKYRRRYIVGTAYETVGYKTSGVSACWVKQKYRVPYVITFELRDTGRYGFALPPNEILPCSEEVLDGITSILTPKTSKFIKLKNQKDALSDISTRMSDLDLALLFICNSLLIVIAR